MLFLVFCILFIPKAPTFFRISSDSEMRRNKCFLIFKDVPQTTSCISTYLVFIHFLD
jgi:hypothetical protein